jgi:hypothetical protein
MGIFEQLPLCQFVPAGATIIESIVIPVVEVRDSMGLRVGRRNRWKRRGQKLDQGGPTGEKWTIKAEWFNNSEEPGIPADSYPRELNRLQAAFDAGGTGTIYLPTIGPRRAKMTEWERIESSGERDFAATSTVFEEDNEDTTTTASFSAPSAKSTVGTMSTMASQSLKQVGVVSEDLSPSGGLQGLGAEVERLANAPDDFAGELQAKARELAGLCKSIEHSVTRGADDMALLLRDPFASRALRDLRAVRDLAMRVVGEEAARPSAGIRTVSYPAPIPIAAVASAFGVSIADLLKLNPDLCRNPHRVPANVTITVPA